MPPQGDARRFVAQNLTSHYSGESGLGYPERSQTVVAQRITMRLTKAVIASSCVFALAPNARASESSAETSTYPAEIVVTARKIAENLQDVPVAISVLSGESMIQNGLVSLQDYYASIPGLSVTDSGNGRISVTMRGLSSGNGGNPTVAVTIDDVPIGASDTAIINGGQFVPQLDPADLQRIEFLKGPQGTLYGASSLAGVMRYVTAAPSLNSMSGHVDVDGNFIPGGGAGYGVRGSVNLPLITDTVAVRLSAFDRRDPGFVDDPTHGLNNVNSRNVYGAHAALLLQATPDFSVRLSGFS